MSCESNVDQILTDVELLGHFCHTTKHLDSLFLRSHADVIDPICSYHCPAETYKTFP